MENLIRAWRDATIFPAMADVAELEVRRLIADNDAHLDQVRKDSAKRKGTVTSGELDNLAAMLGGEMRLAELLAERKALKREHAMQAQIDALLERIAKLEAKAFPRGGGVG